MADEKIGVIVYTNVGCPRCEILMEKLGAKNIAYVEKTEFDRDMLAEHGFTTLPVLELNGEQMDFAAANKWINEV